MMLSSFPDAQPVEGLIGGLLARATGIAQSGPPRSMALNFVTGLVLGGFAYELIFGPVTASFPPSLPLLAVAGLIVGFGTRLGSGCTSGHGVCGLSRLSRRSITATLVFIGSGVVSVAAVNALGGGW